MSMRYKGGVISATPPTTSTSAATGVWTLVQQMQAQAAGAWPSQPGPYWFGALGFSSAVTCNGYGVAVGSSGNIYVTGVAPVSGNNTLQLAKYNTSGAIQWQRSLSSSGNTVQSQNITVDSSENIYVVGSSVIGGTSRSQIAKYDSSGSIQWQRNLTGGAACKFYDVATDSSGNVYAVGVDVSNTNAIVVKYNSSGTLQWQRNIVGTGGLSRGFGIAVDSSSNVYITGLDTPSVLSDVLLIKYNSSGTLQWQRSLDGGSSDVGASVATDSSGNVYVAGYSVASGVNHIQIEKYDTSGTIQWQRSLSSVSTDQANRITVDSSGSVYITGISSNSPSGLIVAKYNTSGVIQWQRKFSTNMTGQGVSVDSLGNVYVSGDIYLSSNAAYNILIAKLPGDGSLTGTYTLGGSSFTYAASTLTDATTSFSSSTSSLTSSTSTLTDAASSLTDAASSLTSSVTTIP